MSEHALTSTLRALLRTAAVAFLLVVAVGVAAVLLRAPGAPETSLVIGEWFPSLWDAAGSLALLGCVALLVAGVVRFELPETAPPRHSPIRRVLRAVLVVALCLAVPVALVVTAAGTVLADSYRILPGRSDGGCRIAVHEHSFLLSGGGRVGVVQPGALTVVWTRGYSADDGAMPFSSELYELEWRGREARIELFDRGPDPIWWNDETPLHCER